MQSTHESHAQRAMRRVGLAILFAFLLSCLSAFAQDAFKSIDVQPDHSVTFRFRDAGAKQVLFVREGTMPVPMTKDDAGIWSITTAPLEPDYYGYSFIADGNWLMDPDNPNFKPNLISPQSVFHVAGATPQPWEVADVPHGTLHHQFYKSNVIGDQRDYFVYTPAGYDPGGKTKYPVLYLLHGYSDDASGWTAVGKANAILDNLIAQGKAKPMIVVMTLGYGAPEMLLKKWNARQEAELHDRNLIKFREALLTEVLPQIEKDYRVSRKAEGRAIAGLSMGGSESLLTGLNNPDKFAWVGAFSSGSLGNEFTKWFPAVDAKVNEKLKLLWIACGTEDWLIKPNREMFDWLKSKNVKFTPVETPGAHTWMVWRRDLVTFSSMIFQK
jgi:enterochelin esterase family protein